LEHLGIIDEIGIVEKTNKIFLVDSRQKVNTGEIVKVIILNGLGFVWRPLYLFTQFFEEKAIEHLLGAGVEAEDVNDDKIGRVMDKLYKYRLTKLFLIIALEVDNCLITSKKIWSSNQIFPFRFNLIAFV
jgi:transposase